MQILMRQNFLSFSNFVALTGCFCFDKVESLYLKEISEPISVVRHVVAAALNVIELL